MKKNQWFTAAAVFALSTSLALAAPHGDGFAGKHGRHKGKGELGERFAQKLNLTDAQKAQIKQINESFREQNRAFFESTRATREQVKEARKANDTARLEALRPTIESQRVQMKQLHDAKTAQILSVLTAEQRQQWEAMKAERGERHRRHGRKHDG